MFLARRSFLARPKGLLTEVVDLIAFGRIYESVNSSKDAHSQEAQGFDMELVSMMNTHHTEMRELLIGRDLMWARGRAA
jgi:hypothetical protein